MCLKTWRSGCGLKSCRKLKFSQKVHEALRMVQLSGFEETANQPRCPAPQPVSVLQIAQQRW